MHEQWDLHKIENYRPTALSSVIAKIFMKLIEMRIRNTLNGHRQAGFR